MAAETRVALGYLLATFLLGVALFSIGAPPFQFAGYVANAILYFCAWFIIASAHALWLIARVRPQRPIGFLADRLFGQAFRARLRQTWPLIAASIVFMPTFSAMKSAIPLFNAYSWDATLIVADRQLHGGVDPWRLLLPFVGYPFVTSAISVAYQAWLLLLYAGTIYFLFYVDDRALRSRYFLANLGIWTVVGVLLAILFASVGPCFVGPLLGNPYFDGQMAYLHHANEHYPVMVLPVQKLLLEWQLAHSHGLGSGITAMPSMHVAQAFLFFLAARHASKMLGRFFMAFFCIILVGSVHLGYHYALDGYVSVLITAIIWAAAGWLVRTRVDAPTSMEGGVFQVSAAPSTWSKQAEAK